MGNKMTDEETDRQKERKTDRRRENLALLVLAITDLKKYQTQKIVLFCDI